MPSAKLTAFIRRLSAADDAHLYLRFAADDLSKAGIEHGAVVTVALDGRATLRGIIKTTGATPWLAPESDSSNEALSSQLVRAGFKLGEDCQALLIPE